jgi:hypothetical protein
LTIAEPKKLPPKAWISPGPAEWTGMPPPPTQRAARRRRAGVAVGVLVLLVLAGQVVPVFDGRLRPVILTGTLLLLDTLGPVFGWRGAGHGTDRTTWPPSGAAPSSESGCPEGSAVTEAVIRLSQALHLRTVAEGIETGAQADELMLLGCDTGQGYLYARPMPAEDVEALLAQTAPPPVTGRTAPVT